MSSSEGTAGPSRRRRFRGAGLATLLAGMVLLGGCTVQPVYMKGTSTAPIAANLAAIQIEGTGDRVGQEVRNDLAFSFTGGEPAPPPLYTLALSVSSSEVRLGFNTNETSPAYEVTVATKFELKEIASGAIVLRSIANGVASYNRSNQQFANERARIDAENRAAAAASEEIQLRLALALAKRRQIAPAAPLVNPAPPGSSAMAPLTR